MGLTKPRAAQIFDIDYKQSTRVITVGDVTLAGGAPSQVDGVNLAEDDRVLVTGQNTASQNGLYFVSSVGTGADGIWLRTSDGNENGEIQAGMIVMVTEGTLYHDTQWKLTTNDPIVIGTTALTFVINILSQIGGSNTQIQYNNAGTMGGSPDLTWNGSIFYTNGAVSVTGNVNTGANVSVTGAITGGSISTAGNIVGNNISTSTAFVTKTILETVTVNASAFASPSNYDILTQSVWYSTASASANFTLNIRGNSTVTANTLLSVGQSMTFALMVTNGATPYYPNAFQVDTVSVTPIYQGGTAFSSGNANSTDVYSFTLIKTAATPTYKLLASQTKFA